MSSKMAPDWLDEIRRDLDHRGVGAIGDRLRALPLWFDTAMDKLVMMVDFTHTGGTSDGRPSMGAPGCARTRLCCPEDLCAGQACGLTRLCRVFVAHCLPDL